MVRAQRLLPAALLAAASTLALLAAHPAGAADEDATQTRDWSAIDSNRDHYISPSEMQTYLDKVWQQQDRQG